MKPCIYNWCPDTPTPEITKEHWHSPTDQDMKELDKHINGTFAMWEGESVFIEPDGKIKGTTCWPMIGSAEIVNGKAKLN